MVSLPTCMFLNNESKTENLTNTGRTCKKKNIKIKLTTKIFFPHSHNEVVCELHYERWKTFHLKTPENSKSTLWQHYNFPGDSKWKQIDIHSPVASVAFGIKIQARQTDGVFHIQSAILQWPCVLLVAAKQIKRPPTGSPSAHTKNHAISTFTNTQSPNPTWPPCLLPGSVWSAQSACIRSCVSIIVVVVEMTNSLQS